MATMSNPETQEWCRSCGKLLRGTGGSAYDPETGEKAKINQYGGFVCSRQCDVRACVELEQSMPGAVGYRMTESGLSPFAKQKIRDNWDLTNE